MKILQKGMRAVTLVALTLMWGCGDNGNVDINVNTNIPPAPVPEAVVSVGVSTVANSIIVNGVRYRTDNVRVFINGQAGNLADIRPGHIIAVTGAINADGVTGTADSIDYQTTLRGPIDNVDMQAGRISVIGQTVLTYQGTVFDQGIDPQGVAGLTVGSWIDVSGFPSAGGEVLATRISVAPAGPEVRLFGPVSGLNLADLLFNINRQIVDYGSTAVIDLPGGMPENGSSVLAVGSLVDGILVAEELSAAAQLPPVPGLRIQMSGFITRFGSATDFDVEGIPVTIGVGTAFSRGSVSDLRPNSWVLVDGDVVVGYRVLAGRVTFIDITSETETLRFGFQDFNQLTVNGVFDATISSDADYSVLVTFDQAIADQLDVYQDGEIVNIGFQGATHGIDTLEAEVTLPTLGRVELGGVATGRLTGFNQAQLIAAVSGVSTLYGESDVIPGLTASVDGVSRLDFGNVRPISAASINVSGVSAATLNMGIGASLTGSVTGTSRLYYYGTNVGLDVVTDATSSLVRLGDTRP